MNQVSRSGLDPAMLSAERSIVVGRSQAEVWAFVRDMGNWAGQMPGYLSHEAADEDHSSWTVLVNLGPFKRPVVVDVEVLRWSPPGEVDFKLKGRSEPFHGGGTFIAVPQGTGTAITLRFDAQPTGPMAVMLTGLARPVLERVADEFTANLGAALDGRERAAPPAEAGWMAALRRWLMRLFGGAR